MRISDENDEAMPIFDVISNRAATTMRGRMNADHATFRQTKHFGSLDGLRCMSILPVVWHHTGGAGYEHVPFLASGWFGVSLFFAISGFLITTLLLRERDQTGTIAMRKFYARRTLRIFPLYYAVVGVYAALSLAGLSNAGDEYIRNLPYFITYTANFIEPEPVLFALAWSLATEEQFYLTWPWVEKHLPRQALWIMLALVMFLLPLDLHVFDSVLGTESWPYEILIRIQMPICLGVVGAHLLHSERSFRWMAKLFGHRFSSMVLLTGTLALLALPWSDVRNMALFFVLAGLVISCVMREDHVLAPILRLRPIVDIGVVSYGIYLLHMLVGNAITRLPFWPEEMFVAHFVATAALTYLVAKISFHTFEAYFLRMKKRFTA